MTEKNIMLNFLKGIACISVVFIHITFPGELGNVIKLIGGYAVPIFLMISGYYAFNKNEIKIKKRLFKILKIFIISYILFFIFGLLIAFTKNEVASWLINNYNYKTPIMYIIFCTIDFAIPLWYLIAMIETYLLWYFLIKFKKEQMFLKFTPLLFIIQIILVTFCETKELEWFWKINFITRALPWFLLGYYIHTLKKELLNKIKFYKIIICILIASFLIVVPTICDIPIKFTSLGYLPLAISLFILAIKYPYKSLNRIIEFIGEKLSLYVYILHTFVGAVLGVVVEYLFKFNIEDSIYYWFHPLIVLFTTIVASLIIHTILQRLKNSYGIKRNNNIMQVDKEMF